MSKTKDFIIDTQQQKNEESDFSYQEEKALEKMVQHIPTVAEVTKKFGTFENYIKALAMYTHPRHNEAMSIRNQRVQPKNEYYDKEDTYQILLDERD